MARFGSPATPAGDFEAVERAYVKGAPQAVSAIADALTEIDSWILEEGLPVLDLATGLWYTLDAGLATFSLDQERTDRQRLIDNRSARAGVEAIVQNPGGTIVSSVDTVTGEFQTPGVQAHGPDKSRATVRKDVEKPDLAAAHATTDGLRRFEVTDRGVRTPEAIVRSPGGRETRLAEDDRTALASHTVTSGLVLAEFKEGQYQAPALGMKSPGGIKEGFRSADIDGVRVIDMSTDGLIWGRINKDLTREGTLSGSTDPVSRIVPSYFADPTTKKGFWTDHSRIIFLIIVWGQSNAAGRNDDAADAIISGTGVYPANALMPSTGLHVDGTSFASLAPLVETAVSNTRETITSSLVNHLIGQINADIGITPTIAAFLAAQGGQEYDNLNRGSDTYNHMLAAVEDIAQIAKVQDKRVICLGVDATHGESDDFQPPEYYAAAMRQFARTINADIKQITEQSEDVLLFLSQVATGVNRSAAAANHVTQGPGNAVPWLHGEGNIRTVDPMYQYPRLTSIGDNTHLTGRSQYNRGIIHAQAFYAEHCGQGWNPMYPIGHEWMSDTELDLIFARQDDSEPVIITDEAVRDPTNTNGGFEVVARKTLLNVTPSIPYSPDVAVHGKRRVRLTFDAAVTQSSLTIYYGQRNETVGEDFYHASGTLASSHQYVSQDDASTHRQWCLSFIYTVPGP